MTIDVGKIATTMDPAKARERYRSYMRAFVERNNSEYRQAAELYKVAGKGRPIVNIDTVIPAAGLFPTLLPRLAIARADARFVKFSTSTYTGSGYRPGFQACKDKRGWSDNTHAIVTPAHAAWADRRLEAVAAVPIIPPECLPAKSTIKEHYVLWEAEWASVPKDPLLLRRIHGPLFAVVAQWDLTDIERAVLAGRI